MEIIITELIVGRGKKQIIGRISFAADDLIDYFIPHTFGDGAEGIADIRDVNAHEAQVMERSQKRKLTKAVENMVISQALEYIQSRLKDNRILMFPATEKTVLITSAKDYSDIMNKKGALEKVLGLEIVNKLEVNKHDIRPRVTPKDSSSDERRDRLNNSTSLPGK